MKYILYLFISSLIFSGSVHAGEKVVIITNTANTQSLSMHDVKSIYSDIVTTWENGKNISVYNLP
ncbi:MAG: hypothetical protein KAJ95_00045, partial [Gammaproteobacteria bacterium]|nr:hypothetical protein [Gammaproteobacteria bacterium]